MDMRSSIDIVDEALEEITPILFVVHPDSACGSADFNLGDEDAEADREKLETFIAAWTGGVVVLVGEDVRQLRQRRYRALGTAIDAALAQAEGTGISMSLAAPDPKQMAVARKVVRKLALESDHPIVVTGAWASRGKSGCVTSVVQTLRRIGYTNVTLSESAVYED